MGHNPSIDLINELQYIYDFLSRESQEHKSETQLKILIRKKIDSVSVFLNQLNNAKDISVEDKTEALEKALYLMNDIIYAEPEAIGDQVIFYKLYMFRTYFAASLMQYWGDGGVLRVRGTANALVNILSGIEPLDVTSILVDNKHPEFMERLELAFNILNTNAKLFYLASTSLYNISTSNMQEWVTTAFNFQSELLTLIELIWDVPLIYQKSSELKHFDSSYHFFGDVLHSIILIIRFIITCQGRFDGVWPVDSDHYPKIDVSSTEKVFETLDGLYQLLENYLSDFRNHVHQGSFDPNDRPLEEPTILLISELKEQCNLVICGLVGVHKHLITKEKGIQELREVNTNIINYLTTKSSMMNDPHFLKTDLGDEMVFSLGYFIYHIGVLSLHTKDISLIETLEEALGQYMQEKGKERFPQLHSIILYARITLGSTINKPRLMLDAAEELIKVAEILQLQPRDSFSFKLLGYLIKVVMGYEQPLKFFKIMNREIIPLTLYLGTSIAREIENYIEAIENAINKKEPTYIMDRQQYSSAFDPYSVMIPNLETYATNRDFGIIIYLPFNLERDYLQQL
ncbi:MAG: hypothetical protein ACTSYA_06750 [Candidatus Kariarchaeaceae archaeon]